VKLPVVALGFVLFLNPLSVTAQPSGDVDASGLQGTIASLDAQVFDAFNRCGDPDQLARHASFFDEKVEFYHDNGGVTWSRDEMLARTSANVCGKFTRELVAGSLEVFPIKGFGAIAQGTHRFCQVATGDCEGLADFTIIWRELNGTWQITRVLSYGHRAAGA